MARTLTAHLQQEESRNNIRLFELFDDRFLRIRRQAGKGKRIEYAMDIAILAPEERPVQTRPWHWLIIAGACAFLLLLIGLYVIFAPSPAHAAALWLLAGALAVTIGATVSQFFRDSRHLVTIRSRLAAVPLVEMLADKPQSPEVATFSQRLIHCINETVANKALSAEDLRAGELRSLRKLAESHVIDLTTYEQAKQHLLSLKF